MQLKYAPAVNALAAVIRLPAFEFIILVEAAGAALLHHGLCLGRLIEHVTSLEIQSTEETYDM